MKLPLISTLAMAVMLAGCATAPDRLVLPEPLPGRTGVRPPADPTPSTDAPMSLQVTAPPTARGTGPTVSGLDGINRRPSLAGPALTIAYDDLAVPAFINDFIGTRLGVAFRMSPEVSALQDLVSLRVPNPTAPGELYDIALGVLGDYGVVADWTDEGILAFSLGSQQGSPSMPPLVVSGRAMPNVPVSHRPVFQVVELRAVRTTDVISWLKDSLKVEGVEVSEDARRNAITLQGRPSAVSQIVAAIQVLDRPTLKGSFSRRLEPAFLTSTDLATQLTQAMNAQGYAATMTLDGLGNAILILPIVSNNSVLVFASSQDVLEHVLSWARTIDRPNRNQGQNGLFYYQVRNTRASDLATVLGVPGAASASQGQQTAQATAATSAPSQPGDRPPVMAAAPSGASQGLGTAGQMVIDEPRNALVFRGNPTEWEQLLPLIRQMDRAPRQVMIEVTIAEVSLDDSMEFGLSWFAKDTPGRFNGRWNFGTVGGSGTGTGGNSGGLSYLLDIAGQNRAQLRAFADDQRVTILSTPRLMVKSGGVGSIDVGTEVPLITQQTTSDQQTDGDTNLLQAIQYRKTGILLEVTPIIYSDNRIDLEIRQEVSEALPVADGSSVPSPSIFNRSLSTSLSLRDGGSVVLGGLISERSTSGATGIPGLKDVPVLGNLFKSQGKQRNKTELVILIVPYIIEENDDAQRIARAVADELTLMQLPRGVGTYVPEPAAPPAQQPLRYDRD